MSRPTLIKRTVFIMLACSACLFPLTSKEGQFTILSLNDTHSHLFSYVDGAKQKTYGGAARWKSIIDDVKHQVDDVLVLHGGDFLTGSDSNYLIEHSPNWERLPTYGYRGMLDIPILDMIGVDAACLGNHEFDYGLPWLLKLVRDADFNVLSANLEYSPIPLTDEFARSESIKGYALFERSGLKIAVIGLTTDEFIKTSQLRIRKPEQVVRQILGELEGRVDFVVVLSHLGYERDVELAKAVKGIDIIVGGHTHTTLREAVKIGDTLITQTGAYGESIGRLDIVVRDSRIIDYDYRLIPVELSLPEDFEVATFLQHALDIGFLQQSYSSDFSTLSDLGRFVSEILMERYSAEAAITMSRMAQGTLPDGQMTPERFFSVFWPYRLRSYGPEKDMTVRQVLDIIQGVAPRIAKKLLYIAEGLSNIVIATMPVDALTKIVDANAKLAGLPEFLQILVSGQALSDGSVRAVMDFQSYRMLYEMGLIDASVPREVKEQELFEVMLEKLSTTGKE